MSTLHTHSTRVKIACNLIKDSGRLREDYSHVQLLADSISARGLICPIVITTDYTLVDGGSRLRSCRDVLKWDSIDVVFLENMSDEELRLLEVEANVKRKDFTWQERVIGVLRVHELKKATSALESIEWTRAQTGNLLGVSKGNVDYCVTLGKYLRLKDPEICKAQGPLDAIKILFRRREAEATKILAGATIPTGGQLVATASRPETTFTDSDFFTNAGSASVSVGAITIQSPDLGDELPGQPEQIQNAEPVTIPLSSMLLRGDCLLHMSSMSAESVDHVITDIPYGIDMENLDQQNTGIDVSSVAAEHTVEGNIELMLAMMPSVYKVLKPSGFFIFFYDLSHHEKLYNAASLAGFRVQRWPLIWHKTHTCINQAAGKNFTKNYEVAMVCSKGNSTLVQPQGSSVWTGGNEDIKQILQHPFAKPLKLWTWLFGAVAIRGQCVYDPFAGVGSSTIAAIDFGLRPLASELNEEHFNRLVVNIAKLYTDRIKNVKFV